MSGEEEIIEIDMTELKKMKVFYVYVANVINAQVGKGGLEA